MTDNENYGAFMAPEKLREDSATIAEETSMFGQRQSYISPTNINRVQEVRPAHSSEDGSESEEGGFDEGMSDDDESLDDSASISSKISRFSVKSTKVKVPRFKDKWTGYQWCRRQAKIIEKMTGKRLERRIAYGDDPNEFAFYLKCQEQDAYVDSTCKWLTQMLIGVCGGMESGSRFLRKFLKQAPNFDGLTDNNMAVLDEYEVLFMQMDESVGERFRQIDPMWRVCFIFFFQLVSTAAVNYGTKAMMNSQGANPLGALGLDTTNIQSMAQNMSDSVLKGLDGGAQGPDTGATDMASMMQGMMKNIMPMMQSMMTGMETSQQPAKKPRKEKQTPDQQVITLDQTAEEELDELPLLQTITEDPPNQEQNNDVDLESGSEGSDFEIRETAGQSSHTVDLNEFE
jgi:hypothetical protein